ncbi:hypothetical protein [Streptomyces boncukensis]|uniref:HK97 gp10 family phage protein n=1 Tax=Streptomyces boncukensis TaxID=2711219 RepID=A0A6G4WTA9_9ACTN|nr:hypothetical protein [Streptomyces boncukensis]NGO68519.1 hypothetical protein [Streptomyces boncukensis]
MATGYQGRGIQVRVRGPLFDGRAARAAADYSDEVEKQVAEEGARMVHQRLRQVLKHPTGYYQSQVRVRAAGGRHVVSDGGVIYGPWLEGTGSRNFPETRFRGYATFRRTQALLDRKARNIAEQLFSRRYRRRFE